MHDYPRPRQHLTKRRIFKSCHTLRQLFLGPVALVTNQQQCPFAERLRCFNRVAIKVFGHPERRRTERENNRRRSIVEEFP